MSVTQPLFASEDNPIEVGVSAYHLGYTATIISNLQVLHVSESWSGPAVFVSYDFSESLSIKSTYYALSSDGYGISDILPWKLLYKANHADMHGIEASINMGSFVYGSLGLYKNFDDYAYVLDQRGALMSLGVKERYAGVLIDFNFLNIRMPFDSGSDDNRITYSSLSQSLSFSYRF